MTIVKVTHSQSRSGKIAGARTKHRELRVVSAIVISSVLDIRARIAATNSKAYLATSRWGKLLRALWEPVEVEVEVEVEAGKVEADRVEEHQAHW